jgi:4-alpha-glucanotransferase
MAARRRVLEDLSRTFFAEGSTQRRRAYAAFLRANKGVETYADFRAVTERQRKGWRAWPARLRNGTIRSGDYDPAARNYHLYAQWIVQEQLQGLAERANARGQFLYLDLPLGLNGAGYDIWRHRNLFLENVDGGAPPDPVFTQGQNWGFPPMNPEAMRQDRYRYFIAYVRNHLRFARLLRIDHVMGVHRLYCIPSGLGGENGVYLKYPAEELWAILALESHRHKAGIVGENLGTVPPAVNTAMAKHHIRGMYVIQYEIMEKPDDPALKPPPERCVAGLNTHDMPPFRAFLDGADIEDRLDLGFLDTKAARSERQQRGKMKRALAAVVDRGAGRRPGGQPVPPGMGATYLRVLRFLARSRANIVLVNVEDLWQETRPQNVPATSAERPNWRRRVRPSLEQIRRMAGLAEVLSDVFAERSRSVSV